MALLPIFHKTLLNPYALQYDNKSEMYISLTENTNIMGAVFDVRRLRPAVKLKQR